MPKAHEWSKDLRELLIKYHSDGDSICTILKKANLRYSIVHYITKKWNQTGTVINRVDRDRKRLTTNHIDHIIHRKIISNRRKSTDDVVIELKNEYGISINAQSIRNRMHEIGYRRCTTR